MRVQRQNAWIDLLPDYAMKFYAIQGLYDPTAIRPDELFTFRMDGYNHYFMDFYDKDAPCNVYSFGVDFDFSGLSYLWHRYPQCRLTIADRNIGNSGDLSAALPHPKLHKWTLGGQNGTYESEESKSLSQWFKKNGKQKMIDLLVLNLKGNEYSVMSTLAEEIKFLPVICQMNIRIHFPP
ncbi:hypothetical protein M3Y98_01141800 [Aphelenchoides besseyi]|nr:hypothetical protein M3Y98_01141800 [Aphelenchoides besseyi]KAI6210691.1 hypothetical protein M3Y96_00354800 [Aphelenchoides besseyi]